MFPLFAGGSTAPKIFPVGHRRSFFSFFGVTWAASADQLRGVSGRLAAPERGREELRPAPRPGGSNSFQPGDGPRVLGMVSLQGLTHFGVALFLTTTASSPRFVERKGTFDPEDDFCCPLCVFFWRLGRLFGWFKGKPGGSVQIPTRHINFLTTNMILSCTPWGVALRTKLN